jgi:hypothetical protein
MDDRMDAQISQHLREAVRLANITIDPLDLARSNGFGRSIPCDVQPDRLRTGSRELPRNRPTKKPRSASDEDGPFGPAVSPWDA